MGTKSPRLVKPYPRLRPKTGLRRLGRITPKWSLIRQKRPRRHARAWKYQTRLDAHSLLEQRASQNIRGSLQERIFYKALVKRGFKPGVDFTFQTSQLGGRMELGGLVADFLFPLPQVVVQVQSMWHTVTAAHERRDEDQFALLRNLGYTVLEIWPHTIENEDELDRWMIENIMALWGTSTQGLSVGGGVSSLGYLDVMSQMLLMRIDQNVDALLRINGIQ